MPASSSTRISISNDKIKTAVAQLVRAAVNARVQLSARGIRNALEIEFACDLQAKRDAILLAIQAALAAELRRAEPTYRDLEHAGSDSKRRKLSRTRRVAASRASRVS